MIFEPQLETLPRDRLAELQLKRLRRLLERVKRRVPLYRERGAHAEPEDLGGCSMTVTLVAPDEAPRSEAGKIQRVRDPR